MAAPIPLPAVETIPAELRQCAQWVAWDFNAKGDKVPINSRTGKLASVSDPSTWGNFGTAYRYAQKHNCGIGFVFTEQDPYCGVDLDDCRDPARGTMTVETWERIAALDSYSEVSPSGTGVKIFLKAKPDRNYNASETRGIEVYAWGRFFTVTGQHVQGTPDTIEQRQAEVDALIAEVFGSNGHTAAPIPGKIPQGQRNSTLTSLAGSLRRRGLSEDVIERALLAVNAAQCEPPLDDNEVRKIAGSIGRKLAPDPAEGELSRDYAHAAVLAKLFMDRYRWGADRGSWMTYDGRRWVPATEEEVTKEASDALRREYAAALAAAKDKAAIQELSKKVAETCVFARIQGALNFLKGWPGILTALDEHRRSPWDRDPWLLNCANGTLDLRNCTLRPHDPADLCTKLAPVNYDPNARSERWEAHLRTCLPDPEVRREVQRNVGVSLTGANLEEVLPIWHGAGGNGRSTTIRAIQGCLGDYAQMAAPRLLIAGKYERHPAELADLCGARVVFAVEIGATARLDEERVKMLTGGDTIKGRFMGQNFFEFPRTWTITLVCNHRPTIADSSHGMWRRVRLIPWTATVPRGQQRPQEEVVQELLADAPAILAWMVAGLRDWQADHRWVAGAVLAATDEYRRDQDVLSGFLAECCKMGPRYEVAKADVYDAYTKWCATNDEAPLSKRELTIRLRDRGIGEKKADKGERRYTGFRLLTDEEKQQVALGGTCSNSSRESENSIEDLESVPPSATYPEKAAEQPPEPPNGHGDPPPAGIPQMITRAMESQLRGMGYSQRQIDRLTPLGAMAILRGDGPPECGCPTCGGTEYWYRPHPTGIEGTWECSVCVPKDAAAPEPMEVEL
ncbi:MAG: phage/plasmid primase, P4 family [Sphingomonadaceae bacterium]